jgi:hypothetical protein
MAEILEMMLHGVLEAPEEAAATAIRLSAASLADSPTAGPAGWTAVSRALLCIAEGVAHSCWEDGWQPADLARVVRRELSARHVRFATDIIAAESRRYAAAGMDPRWSAQLSELAATVWWDDDGSYLSAFGDREGIDRVAVATCALELLRLLSLLPPIAPAGPPPGSGHRNGSGHRARQPTPGTSSEARTLDRIRALLAKAESTEYAEEAEALTAKAQELMARYSISEALLAADIGNPDEPVTRRIGIDNPYEAPKALLLDAVANANRCRTVWSRDFGFSTVVGFEPDLDAVELLFTSLLVQATTAMNRAGTRRDAYGRSRTRAFRQSFLVAYAHRIRERLTAATAQATADAAAGTAPDGTAPGSRAADPRLLPVLAAREDAVNDTTERLFPELTRRSLTSNDREGWAYGTAAADRAQLHNHAEVIAPA